MQSFNLRCFIPKKQMSDIIIPFWSLCYVIILSFTLIFPSYTLAKTIDFKQHKGKEGFRLLTADGKRVRFSFTVSKVNINDVSINGEKMQQVSIPGVIMPCEFGMPNLPGRGQYIAIPKGATIDLQINDSSFVDIPDIYVAPASNIPKDTEPLLYKKDNNAYSIKTFYPEKTIIVSEQRKIRGLDVVIVNITPFQWNPTTKILRVYDHVDVSVSFKGGNGQFGENRLRNRFFEPILDQNVLNYSSLPRVDFDSRIHNNSKDDEFEYIIIVPDDTDFITWANVIKSWRIKQGITTEVFTETDIGSTTTEIEAFIDDAYLNWTNPPVAVLLMADYPGTGYDGIDSPIYNSYCISDNLYADVDGDHLPDINFARITAQDATHLSIMINKFLNYEQSPITDVNFYDNPVAAGGWQSDRWFILCADIVYGFWENVLGKSPIREYAGTSGAPSSWSSNTNTYMLLDYFGPPPGLGYVSATPAHLTDWGANATRLNNDINNGTFIIVHRDHGGVDGWSEPDYKNPDLAGLSNGDKLPFVFSINCLTGKFDESAECFAEAFHRMQGGALGLMAATEVSYSFVNDTYVFGMIDSMWPDFDPGNEFIPLGEQPLRPGFANVSGKYYLEASNWPSNPTSKEVTYYLFHMHGDAFTTLYSEVPQNLTVLHDDTMIAGTTTFSVTADAGSFISLTVGDTIIGRADGTGSPVVIPITAQSPPSIVLVTVTKPNYYRYEANVPVIVPAGPWFVHETHILDDSAGNGDGIANPGEVIVMPVTLENVGIADGTGISGTLSTTSGNCSITDNYATYQDIVQGATGQSLPDHYAFTVDAGVTNGELISFQIDWTASGSYTGSTMFSVPICEILTISNVTVTNITPDSATITWDTNVPADSVVTYGPSIPPSLQESSSSLRLNHSIDITGLTNCTRYYFSVSSTSPSCYSLTDDNGGAYYEFTTYMLLIAFFDDMEGGVGDWTCDGLWHQVIEPTCTPSASSPSTSWYYGQDASCDFDTGTANTGRLYSSPITDITFGSELSFWYRRDTECGGCCTYDNTSVQISTDGGSNWTTLEEVCDDSGSWVEYSGWDLSAYAGQTINIGFYFDSYDGYANNYLGWMVDDVEISKPSPCPDSSGEIFLDENEYGCLSGTVEVTIFEADLMGTADAVLASTAGDSETVVCSETIPGVFVGTITTSDSAVSTDDGILQVAHADTVTATYYDADDGTGNPAVVNETAVIDCAGPVISNIQVINITDNSATITWDTDDNSTSMVTYDRFRPPVSTVEDLNLVSSHSVDLTFLDSCAVYYFSVTSVDIYGNIVTDDNAGNCYTFTPLYFNTYLDEDMEIEPIGWTHSGQNDDWERGVPTVGPPGTHSGTSCYATNLSGNYIKNNSTNGEYYLYTDSIDLSAATSSVILSFWHYYDIYTDSPTNGTDDGSWLEISNDGGSSWTVLTPNEGYTNTLDDEAPYPYGPCYAGTLTDWEEATFDLSSYAGQVIQLRFAFFEDDDTGTAAPGWYIDDVRIGYAGPCVPTLYTMGIIILMLGLTVVIYIRRS